VACLCGSSYLRQSHTLDRHPQVSTLPDASCRWGGRRRTRSSMCLRSRCGNTGHDAVRPRDGIGLRMVTPVGVADCLFVLARCVSRSRASGQGQKPPAVRVGRGQQSRPYRLSSAFMTTLPWMAERYDRCRPRAKSGGYVRSSRNIPRPWRWSWRSARGPPSRSRPRRPARPRPVPFPRPCSPHSRRHAHRAPTRAWRALAVNLAGRERAAVRGDRRTFGSGKQPGAGAVDDPREGGGKADRRPAALARDVVWRRLRRGRPRDAVALIGMRSLFVRMCGPVGVVVRRGVDHWILLVRRCGRVRPRPGGLPPGCQAPATYFYSCTCAASRVRRRW